jgi:hypothetical protein
MKSLNESWHLLRKGIEERSIAPDDRWFGLKPDFFLVVMTVPEVRMLEAFSGTPCFFGADLIIAEIEVSQRWSRSRVEIKVSQLVMRRLAAWRRNNLRASALHSLTFKSLGLILNHSLAPPRLVVLECALALQTPLATSRLPQSLTLLIHELVLVGVCAKDLSLRTAFKFGSLLVCLPMSQTLTMMMLPSTARRAIRSALSNAALSLAQISSDFGYIAQEPPNFTFSSTMAIACCISTF